MINKETGGPAFPVAYSNEVDGPTIMPTKGMTLRDYFAAQIVSALIQRSPENAPFGVRCDNNNTAVSEASYAIADAMLKARNQ